MNNQNERDAEAWVVANDLDYKKYGDRRKDRSAYDSLMNYEITPMLEEAFLAGRAGMVPETEVKGLRLQKDNGPAQATYVTSLEASLQWHAIMLEDAKILLHIHGVHPTKVRWLEDFEKGPQ